METNEMRHGKSMNKITWIFVVGLVLVARGAVLRADAPVTPAKPNIIFVLADDLGIDGVSCYGADKHKTPNIDALASTGIRFQTCYAAPLCGPSRCLLMTGQYAFRTGGLTNQSWRADGPGAKSVEQFPMARMLKAAGYATGQAGKWRQIGELPGDWGFDEFLTDNTAGGWYWQTHYDKNGKPLDLPEGTYGPDVIQGFTFDFIRRHKNQPFFFYYAMHLVHKPTVRTPDTSPGETSVAQFYDDNIRYMDKQVGALVDEVQKDGLRNNTLIIFSGDNGTAAGYPSSVNGRMINGWKGSMLEGGSRVPLIASWPAVTPAGKVLGDIISFADPYVTFAEIAGAKIPDKVKPDGQSFLPQLRGEPGTPRQWAYVQLGAKWYVREPGYKMDEAGDLFDMSDAPFVEKPIPVTADTEQSKAARQRLAAALAELNPAAGKTDKAAAVAESTANPAGPWKSGDRLTGAQAPQVAGKALQISAEIDPTCDDGVIVSQGAGAQGYAIYLTSGKLAFAVREDKTLTTIISKNPLGTGNFVVVATLSADGSMTLLANKNQLATGKAEGPIPSQPKAPFTVGTATRAAVGEYDPSIAFKGKITNVTVTLTAAAAD
jgi:arylsulfatase A